jgi:hypothetical protein
MRLSGRKRREQIFAGGAMPYMHGCLSVMVWVLVIVIGGESPGRHLHRHLGVRSTHT